MLNCSVCGRELDGVELEFMPSDKWRCAECAGELHNALFSRRNDKIRYVFPTNGTKSAQIMAEKYLARGNTYVVDTIQIGKSESHIKVQGLRYWFNSVLFERVAE